MHKEYSEEIQLILKKLVDHFDREDNAVRERQLLQYRKLKLFWDGYSRVWYDSVAHDWRIYDENQDSSDQAYYDKPINVFRAYLESIIAALSVLVPPIKCYPDDADDILDLDTAKAGDKIAQLIFRHNDVSLLWLHILFVYMTEGMVAIYVHDKTDKAYGTYKKENYEDFEQLESTLSCSACGAPLDSEFTDELKNKYGVNNDDIILQNFILNDDLQICPQCALTIQPFLSQEKVIVTRLVGVTEEPKSRVCMEAFGGLFIKTPTYARKQSECLYLNYTYETHYANILEEFPWMGDIIHGGENMSGSTGGPYSNYEQWARLNPQYQGEYPENNRSVRAWWFRPAAYNILLDEERDQLKKEFPNGVKAVFINEDYCCAGNEALDDKWTLTYNPLSDYLQHDPLGLLLVSVQEITNDLISLTLQTIEHGIGQTFVDPRVLNFKQYAQTEVLPGGVYPATATSGKSIGDGFYQIKTATLSPEILPFGQNIQSLGQLTTGALPSLFGGQMNESKTASEYSMSRAQALQRLQNTWKMLTSAWKGAFGKAIPLYVTLIQDDERWVETDKKTGNFINVFIRKSELAGKIGKVELEANENLPITWNQRKDVVMALLQSGSPEILSIIGAPENLPVIRDAIGLTDFFVPGEDDRNAEYEEIHQLINSEPIVIPPMVDPMAPPEMQMMAQQQPPQEMPSVEVNAEIDNHGLRFEICRAWLVSEAGRLCKVENPNGYKNVLLHALQHQQIMQMQQMQQAMQAAQGQGAVPGEKPKEDTKTPIKEESDVNVG